MQAVVVGTVADSASEIERGKERESDSELERKFYSIRVFAKIRF